MEVDQDLVDRVSYAGITRRMEGGGIEKRVFGVLRTGLLLFVDFLCNVGVLRRHVRESRLTTTCYWSAEVSASAYSIADHLWGMSDVLPHEILAWPNPDGRGRSTVDRAALAMVRRPRRSGGGGRRDSL